MIAAAAALVVVVSGIAHAQAGPPKLDTLKVVEERKEPVRGTRNLITADELLEKNFNSVYEALETLRPFWLRARGPTRLTPGEASAPSVSIYVDNVKLGTTNELKMMSVRNIRRASFLSAPEAQMRFGVGNENGAVVLETLGKDP
jgi:hypothetical protein